MKINEDQLQELTLYNLQYSDVSWRSGDSWRDCSIFMDESVQDINSQYARFQVELPANKKIEKVMLGFTDSAEYGRAAIFFVYLVETNRNTPINATFKVDIDRNQMNHVDNWFAKLVDSDLTFLCHTSYRINGALEHNNEPVIKYKNIDHKVISSVIHGQVFRDYFIMSQLFNNARSLQIVVGLIYGKKVGDVYVRKVPMNNKFGFIVEIDMDKKWTGKVYNEMAFFDIDFDKAADLVVVRVKDGGGEKKKQVLKQTVIGDPKLLADLIEN